MYFNNMFSFVGKSLFVVSCLAVVNGGATTIDDASSSLTPLARRLLQTENTCDGQPAHIKYVEGTIKCDDLPKWKVAANKALAAENEKFAAARLQLSKDLIAEHELELITKSAFHKSAMKMVAYVENYCTYNLARRCHGQGQKYEAQVAQVGSGGVTQTEFAKASAEQRAKDRMEEMEGTVKGAMEKIDGSIDHPGAVGLMDGVAEDMLSIDERYKIYAEADKERDHDIANQEFMEKFNAENNGKGSLSP